MTKILVLKGQRFGVPKTRVIRKQFIIADLERVVETYKREASLAEKIISDIKESDVMEFREGKDFCELEFTETDGTIETIKYEAFNYVVTNNIIVYLKGTS